MLSSGKGGHAMVYREHGMWEILEVLRRLAQGENQRQVAVATGLGRKTIRRYLRQAAILGWQPGTQEPDEALAARVLEHVRPGPKDTGPGQTEGLLLPRREQIQQWLMGTPPDRGLTLTKVRRLLKRQGIVVPYSSLHRFAVEHCQFGRGRITVRCAPCRPGELSEIDFGRLGYIRDPETQQRRLVWALVVILVYSRHMYVHVSHTQKLEDFIDGLEAAWEFFGGVSTRAGIDNLRAAVAKADRLDPFFQRTFNEYARYRGFVIDPAVPRHATHKPFVERQVPHVRESCFRGETFIDLAHVQREAIRWCLETAGTRVHGTTRRRPLGVFEEEERAALRPLTGERFDTPHWADCKVHPDHHVQFRRATYSVPTRYVRQQVTVRGDRSLVRIYFHGRLIKTHVPQPPGGRATDYADYPQERGAYARRDPDYTIQQARLLGESIGEFAARLLDGNFPWAKLRQAQKLLRLAKKYGRPRLEEACCRALAFDVINVKRLEAIVLRALGERPTRPPAQLTLLPARFLRPADSFTHRPPTQEEIQTHGDQAVTESRAQETEALGDAGYTARPGSLCQEGQADLRGLPGTDAPR